MFRRWKYEHGGAGGQPFMSIAWREMISSAAHSGPFSLKECCRLTTQRASLSAFALRAKSSE
jgi:hypothetical protein